MSTRLDEGWIYQDKEVTVFMEHYADYVNKSVPASEIVFEKVRDEDKELVKKIHKVHIKANLGLLIPVSLVFLFCVYGFAVSVSTRVESRLFDVITVLVFALGIVLTAYVMWDILGPFRGIRKGVVLSSERIQEKKDNRNATYQYIFDIYMEELDKTLMSFQVKREVFENIAPGDGVILYKTIRKIKVLADPQRKGAMDVSRLQSGVDFKIKW